MKKRLAREPSDELGRPPRAFHPPLLALYVPLALYAANVSLIPFADVLWPCLTVLASSLGVWAIAWAIYRDYPRSAMAASLVCCGFLFYEQLTILYERVMLGADMMSVVPALPIWLWAGIVLTLILLLTRKGRFLNGFTVFLNIASISMVVLALGSAMFAHWNIRQALAKRVVSIQRDSSSPSDKAPDIFYIILDGYGRTDTFERLYGFSDREFVGDLEQLGFYVARDAHSNYCQTELSLGSSLNLKPVQELATSQDNPMNTRGLLDGMIDDSAVARELKSRGYRYVAIATGFPALTFRTADLRVEQGTGTTLYLNALLQKTPLAPGPRVYDSQFTARRHYLEGAFDTLVNIAPRAAQPRFVILHLLAPHPPFVFGPNGEARRPPGYFGYSDGSHFNQNVGPDSMYLQGYRDQAQYVAKRLRYVLSSLTRKNPDAVVMIQGDHGPKMKLDQDTLEKTDVNEVFGILSAYRGPESFRSRLYSEITPVNSFRLLFEALFGDRLPQLPDRSYYSSWEKPLALVDITEKLSRRE